MYLPRLKDLRHDTDLKQETVAKLLNVSQVAYSRYELGQREIPLELLIELAYYYDISADYILGISTSKQHLEWRPESKGLYERTKMEKAPVGRKGRTTGAFSIGRRLFSLRTTFRAVVVKPSVVNGHDAAGVSGNTQVMGEHVEGISGR